MRRHSSGLLYRALLMINCKRYSRSAYLLVEISEMLESSQISQHRRRGHSVNFPSTWNNSKFKYLMKIQHSPHGFPQWYDPVSSSRSIAKSLHILFCTRWFQSAVYILFEPHSYKWLQRKAVACPLRNKCRNRTSCANISVHHLL